MLLKTFTVIFGFMHCLISTHIGMFSALANTHQSQLILVVAGCERRVVFLPGLLFFLQAGVL